MDPDEKPSTSRLDPTKSFQTFVPIWDYAPCTETSSAPTSTSETAAYMHVRQPYNSRRCKRCLGSAAWPSTLLVLLLVLGAICNQVGASAPVSSRRTHVHLRARLRHRHKSHKPHVEDRIGDTVFVQRDEGKRSVEQSPSKPRPWPAVYIYKLPAPYTDCREGMSPNYAAELSFPRYLKLHGWSVEDPEEADLFYVHAYFYCATSGFFKAYGDPRAPMAEAMIKSALKVVSTDYPYWNRSGGLDHMWLISQDHGLCGFWGNGDLNVPQINSSIILTHWGLMKKEAICEFDDVMRGKECAPWTSETFAVRSQCFTRVKDVVIPHSAVDNFEPVQQPTSKQLEDIHAPRKYVFFMGGAARYPQVWYSHGMRQNLFMMFENKTDWRMMDIDKTGYYPEYEGDFEKSTFCLAATGAGYGVRAKLAVQRGCIPIVIADDVELELEDVLPWPEFSLRLPQFMLYRLPEALQILIDEPDKVREMQRKVACVWRWFTWQAPYGRAGEGVMCSLRRKLAGYDNLKPSMDWDKCQLKCDLPEGHSARRRNLRRKSY